MGPQQAPAAIHTLGLWPTIQYIAQSTLNYTVRELGWSARPLLVFILLVQTYFGFFWLFVENLQGLNLPTY